MEHVKGMLFYKKLLIFLLQKGNTPHTSLIRLCIFWGRLTFRIKNMN